MPVFTESRSIACLLLGRPPADPCSIANNLWLQQHMDGGTEVTYLFANYRNRGIIGGWAAQYYYDNNIMWGWVRV